MLWAGRGSEGWHTRTFAAPGPQHLAANELFEFGKSLFELLRFAKDAFEEIAKAGEAFRTVRDIELSRVQARPNFLPLQRSRDGRAGVGARGIRR